MKKILCLVVACMVVPVLASAADPPAFGNGNIRDNEYQTSGLLKRKDSSTNEYRGGGTHHGVLTEVSFFVADAVVGQSMITPDFLTLFAGADSDYTCRFTIQDYNWEGGTTNKLTDSDVAMICYDPINDPDALSPLLDRTDCTASLKFTDPGNFNGKIKCNDGTFKWILQLSGKKIGKWEVTTPILDQFGDLESFFK